MRLRNAYKSQSPMKQTSEANPKEISDPRDEPFGKEPIGPPPLNVYSYRWRANKLAQEAIEGPQECFLCGTHTLVPNTALNRLSELMCESCGHDQGLAEVFYAGFEKGLDYGLGVYNRHLLTNSPIAIRWRKWKRQLKKKAQN